MFAEYVILGGGIGGCMYALAIKARHPEASVVVIEPGALAGSFGGAGYMFLRHNDDVEHVLVANGLSGSKGAEQRGGIMLSNGVIVPYPAGISPSDMEAVSRLHYAKTRGTSDGWTPDVMNFGGAKVHAVDVMPEDIAWKVESIATVIQASAQLVSPPMISVGGGVWIEATRAIISTVPLPVYAKLRRLDEVERPSCNHRWLHTTRLDVLAKHMSIFDYEYVYTPWLAAAHRLCPQQDGLVEVEWNGGDASDGHDHTMDEANKDAITLAGHRLLQSRIVTRPGHLLPVVWGAWRPESNEWLVGRYAAWEPRMTVDQSVTALLARLSER